MSELQAVQPKRPRRALWIVLAAVAVMLTLCVCIPGILAATLLDLTGWKGWPTAYWSGDGRYAVAQGVAREPELFAAGHAVTVVYDTVTQEVRTLPRYVVVAVEPTGSTIWVAEQGPGFAWLLPPWRSPDQAGDASFQEARGLKKWDLSTPGTDLQEPGTDPWTAVPGPGGTEAQLSRGVTEVAHPSVLSFTDADGETREADMGPVRVFFEPLGWSPSGSYFALVPLSGERARPAEAHVQVYEASTGNLAGELWVPLGEWDRTLGDTVQWAPGEDTLMYVDGGRLYAWDLRTGVEPKALAATVDEPMLGATLLGSAEDGIYLLSDRTVFLLTTGGEIAELGTVMNTVDHMSASSDGMILAMLRAGVDAPTTLTYAAVGTDPEALDVIWEPREGTSSN